MLGFWSELSVIPSLLKSQDQLSGVVPVDWSVNLTVRGALPDVASVVNAAVGLTVAALTVMVFVAEELPAPLETVSFAV